MPEPLVLFEDARATDAADARLYSKPGEIIVAYRADEVLPALARLEALQAQGRHLAGYLAYEAGLALEPRLAHLLPARSGAAAPLVWFGAFDACRRIAAGDLPGWLSRRAGSREAAIGPLEPQMDLGAYRAAFARLHEAVLAGDIYQANLTLPLAGSWRGDPLALYAALRPAAAAGYGGVIHDGTQWLLSFSPELFFTLSRGVIRAKPMKGTRPRGRDPADDASLRAELAASTKDRAENLMILDLMRNDLSRVARAGSVRVEAPFAVETFPTVHQMVSTVTGELRPGQNAAGVLRALFPCGSITGAPKIRAMELLAQVETVPRGPYCGAMGWIEPTGDAAFNVAIRTLRLTGEGGGAGGGRAVLGVGSALVADSEPLVEWRECQVKGGFVRESAGASSPAQFDLIETMRFSPEEGIALLELHLRRIADSARELGFRFDRHAVRNAIQALCFDAERPARLRLVAARGGSYSLELGELPSPLPAPAPVVLVPLPVDIRDWRLRHKTSDRQFHEMARALAHDAGAAEAVFVRDDRLVTEGSFTNVFVGRDGALRTPRAEAGLLPGVLRRNLLDAGKAVESDVTIDDLAGGFFLGNAVRGLMPARLLLS